MDSQPGMQVCEESLDCETTFFKYTPSGNEIVCTNFTKTQEEIATLKTISPGCNLDDLVGCVPETHTICTGSPAVKVCDEDGERCQFLYTNNSCRSVTSYHGPFCHAPNQPGCLVDLTFYQDAPNSRSVEDVSSDCVEYNDSFSSQDAYVKRVQCDTKHYCDSSDSGATLCVKEQNNALDTNVYVHLPNGEQLYCDDEEGQNFGDYWCPKGYRYNSVFGFCVKDTDVCDQGFTGNLETGCDTPFNPQDDYWEMYQKECVFNINTPTGLYDSVCCPDTVFNGFQIWQQQDDTNHVKVY